MNPPAEQLVRDYLNRVSVAARGKLGSAERREFLARMRESIERQTGAPGSADLIDVGKLLSGLGEPRTLVERERARLAQLRGLPDSAAPRSAQLAARPAGWKPRISVRRSAETVARPDAGQVPASEAPPGGEVRVQSRPVTARPQPGEPVEQRPSGPQPPPWTVNGTGHPGTGHPGTEHPGEQRADVSAPEKPRSEPGKPAQEAPQGEPGRPATPQRPQDGPERHSEAHPAPEPVPDEPEPQAEQGRLVEPAPKDEPGPDEKQGRLVGPELQDEPGPKDEPELGDEQGPGEPRPGSEPERTGRMARLRAGIAAAAPAGGSGRLAGAGASLGSITRAAASLARDHPLEACVIVLLGLGGLIYPPIWLVGAFIALLSREWDFRDKWVGLAGPVLLMIVGTALLVARGGHRDSAHLYVREAWMLADYLIRAGAVLGAAYLTWRTQRGPREPPVPPWNRHRI